jgi:hypothetical protein
MSGVQQIQAVHARNLAVQRSRLASVPEVGIFWLIDDKLADGKNDHAALWTTLQRHLPQWKGLEYTDYPRGRVLFHSTEEVFLVYSSQAIINAAATMSKPARTPHAARGFVM